MNLAALVLLAASAPSISGPPQTGRGVEVPAMEAVKEAVQQAAQEARWYADIDEARRIAGAEGKHVLVDFTGTGWCSWCKKLDAQVLGTPLFAEAAASNFVLVKADFDAQGNARRDLPCADKNDALKKSLGVSGFPSIILMTADGTAYAAMGYERGGAGPYVDKLVEQQRRARELEAAVAAVKSAVASASSKEEALAAALAAVDGLQSAGPHQLGRPLVPIVRAFLSGIPVSGATPAESDAEAQAILALSGANVVDDALVDRAFRADPKNAAGLPEAALAAAMRTVGDPSEVAPLILRAEAMLATVPVHDRQVAAQLYGDCAYWIKNWQQDAERARIMATFALRLDPVDENLRRMLKDLAGK
ncbi:Disulfide bond reductase DsbH precursor [Planctomycetes bacterium Poly30]|uniref:Disulfide bond reductase DsbH n=1 Tax=Saltatorellus ferox TaxID=2528018 RepID=A0A518EQH8_9BACT|nr:Disulfide bond reductase DsbH precursor [Planctomycetes bacterium Poly30]